MTEENKDTTGEPTTARVTARKRLEIVAMVYAAIVLSGALWYWQAQVQSVLEILEMAYG